MINLDEIRARCERYRTSEIDHVYIETYLADVEGLLSLLSERNKEIARLREADRWISVTEQLPEDDEKIHFYEDSTIKFTSILAYGYAYGPEGKPYVKEVNRIFIKKTGIAYLDDQHKHEIEKWKWSQSFDEVLKWRKLPAPPNVLMEE